MEENLPWKIVYIATIFSLVVLGFAYYLISPKGNEISDPSNRERIAEFKNTRIEGRKEGKPAWEFFAKEGWTIKDQDTSYLLNVSRGQLYKDGKITVSNLSAPLVKVYRRNELVEAFGQAEGKTGPSALTAYLDLNKFSNRPKEQRKWTKMKADHIKYISNEKRSEINGKVSLVQKDNTLYAERIDIAHEPKIADLSEKVRIKRKDAIMDADLAHYIGEQEQLDVSGNVNLAVKDKKMETLIKCRRAVLFNDPDKDVSLIGDLAVAQGKKLAIAPQGIYSKKQKGLTLTGGTKTIIEKAQAVLKANSLKNLDSPEQKELLKEKTVLTANEIFFSTKTGDAHASGQVIVTQKGKEAKGDEANYDDRKELLTLSGNVHLKRNADWIKCDKVIVSVTKETFEAAGSVEAKFKL